MLLGNNKIEFISKPEHNIDAQGQHHYKCLNYNETSTNQYIITNVRPIKILISINSGKFRCIVNRICRTANNELVKQLSS